MDVRAAIGWAGKALEKTSRDPAAPSVAGARPAATIAWMSEVQRRVIVAVGVVLCVILLGSVGYWWIGLGVRDWAFFDCVYMTVISVMTVGYGETLTGMETVPGAAEDDPLRRQHLRGLTRRALRAPLREAKVKYLDYARGVEDHVLRLHVAMHDPRRVRGREPERELAADPHPLGERHGTVPEQRAERAALDVLEHEVRAGVVLPHLEEPRDVRVRHGRRGLRLAQEAPLALGARRAVTAHHLESDRAAQALVAGLVDDAHPAAADHARDHEAVDRLARHELRGQLVRPGAGEPPQELVRLGAVVGAQGLGGVSHGRRHGSRRARARARAASGVP